MSDPIPFSRMAVLGAGAWGTALALTLLTAGRQTALWVREDEVLAAIKSRGENPFLPGVVLPKDFHATGDLKEAANAEALLLAVPAQVAHEFAAKLAPHIRPGTPLVICAKGIEKNSGRLLNEVVAQACPAAAVAILSGPSFARDVALGLPTAVTIAAKTRCTASS